MVTSPFDTDGQFRTVATRIVGIMDAVDQAIRKLCLGLLSLLLAVVVLNVVMRYVFDNSLVWANELSRYLMVWFALLMTAALINTDDHLNVTLVYEKFTLRTRYWIQVVMMLMYVVIGLVWMTFGLDYTLTAGLQAEAPALNFQLIWVYVVIPISGLLVIAFSLTRLLRLVILGETGQLETQYAPATEEVTSND
ncbi:TRAP transporter small permease [Halorubrum halophilum]|uniref:TRAP transporter small permease n=1 Tax=Halorubrum halophilum TaxID=413816 RepID=UPI0006789F0C|nr:TRAP transporter small permease subunit [Halorubrum halophilum]